MNTLNKIVELLTKQNRQQKELTDYLGIEKSTFSAWKNGKSASYKKYLPEIAAFFNVSTDYLTGESKYKNIQEVKYYNWGITSSNPYFEAPFDFAKLLTPIRENQGVSLSELGEVIGATEEQMEEIEKGLLPINLDQAEKLCNYLDTDVSQILFENDLYDEEVPEKYHNNVREWEKIQKELDDEAMRESSKVLNPDIRMIARAGKKMTPEQAKNLRKYAQYMFPEAFKDD